MVLCELYNKIKIDLLSNLLIKERKKQQSIKTKQQSQLTEPLTLKKKERSKTANLNYDFFSCINQYKV